MLPHVENEELDVVHRGGELADGGSGADNADWGGDVCLGCWPGDEFHFERIRGEGGAIIGARRYERSG